MKTFLVLISLCIACVLSPGAEAQVTSVTEDFDNCAGGNLPTGWGGAANLGTNYGTGNFYADHTSGTGRFAFISNGYLTTMLMAAGSYTVDFWLRISSTPVETIHLGFCTDLGSIPGTFMGQQSFLNSYTSWTNFSYVVTLPSDGYITWKSEGTYKTHCFDDVHVTPYSGVEEQHPADILYHVFPLPAEDFLHISWYELNRSAYIFTLTDLAGNEVLNCGETVFNRGVNNFCMNTGKIRSGCYFLVVKNNNRILKVRKVLIL